MSLIYFIPYVGKFDVKLVKRINNRHSKLADKRSNNEKIKHDKFNAKGPPKAAMKVHILKTVTARKVHYR